MAKHDPLEPCGLCDRQLGSERIQQHHLVPKTFGGKDTVPIHQICHRKIHSLFSERELKNQYFTYEALRSHPDIQTFVDWVKKKPLGFYVGSDTANRRK